MSVYIETPIIMVFLAAGESYHIFNHAVGRDNLFLNEDNYRYFLRRYAYYIGPIAETYAYCLMPNHFHILLKIKTEEELASIFNLPDLQGLLNLEGLGRKIGQQFSNFFNSYTKSFNKYHNRRGALFCHNFHRKKVQDDFYLRSLIEYIHRNPVHHGFCENITDWYWSSYFICLNEDIDTLFPDRQKIFELYDGKRAFIQKHQSVLNNYWDLAINEDYSDFISIRCAR